MKPSKKLMRDFADVVLPDFVQHKAKEYYSEFWDSDFNEYYDLQYLDTVIELASKWSEDGLVMQKLIKGKWRVFVGFNKAIDHKDLPTAIMKAVVEAANK